MNNKHIWLLRGQLALFAAGVASGCGSDGKESTGAAGSSALAGESSAGKQSEPSGAGGEGASADGKGGALDAPGGSAMVAGETSGGTAALVGGAGGEPAEGGVGGEAPDLANREWALWPMPNAAGSGVPHAAKYDTSKADVTLDRITGLTWEAVPSDVDYKWADAKALCKAATIGGYTDWRMPTRIELLSIVDFSKAQPAIDGAAFPACESSGYWATTPAPDNPNYYATIDFELGYGYADVSGELHFVRCVRGTPNADPPHYKVNKGYVTDNATGLNWEMPAPAESLDYAASADRCAALTAGGFNVWRLPTIKELQTLVDVTAAPPAMDTSVFTDVSAEVDMFWSASRDVYFTEMESNWLLQVDTGAMPADTLDGKHRSRCVF